MSTFSVTGLVSRYASRLTTSALLVVTLALLVINVVLPDPLPFVDEILLALAALWLARRKSQTVPSETVEVAEDAEPRPGRTSSAESTG